ncbi:centrosomal protein of 72 kDa-like [Gigantopelta aegis]|uniref:centrosomal protein of 72 kDa-like n=1 Tax=Gigantopelta aegis TaxID=1735272 RepID=UPI001B88D52F|nr:centrosomal protein of 72 kDa-like [Gigantopelta aegis]
MALIMTEELLRNRVNLTHDNLEDVKSVSLPGTFHEKVVSLGTSLRKFTRLKNLDLSRNSLVSLEGLETLKLLETLNLYYNNIDSLDELKRLRHNPNLKELDLRLNPITRSEPDSRLYLIHMLPSLQKLDDRSVRDRERQAALIHFSSGQASEMTETPRSTDPPKRPPNPRVELVNRMQKGVTALDDDDVAVLDLIAQSGGDLTKPRPLTGSAARESKSEDYTLDALKTLSSDKLTQLQDEPEQPEKNTVQAADDFETDEKMAAYRKKYPNIPAVTVTQYERNERTRQQQCDPNLEYQDELQAYTKYKSVGIFTPHPDAGDGDHESSQVPVGRDSYPDPPRMYPDSQRGEDRKRVSDNQRREDRPYTKRRTDSQQVKQDFEIEKTLKELGIPKNLQPDPKMVQEAEEIKARLERNPRARDFLVKLLDMVDRYWNGTKSLHKHSKFKGLALNLIDQFESSGESVPTMKQLEEKIRRLQEENLVLRDRDSQHRATIDGSSANETYLKNSLQNAFQDVETLRDQLEKYIAENKRLQKKIDNQDTMTSYHSGAAASSISLVNQTQLDDLQRQNNALQREIEDLRIRHKQFAQLQDVTVMLQQSHKSLVQTNDHLLTEIEELKHRHGDDVDYTHHSHSNRNLKSYAPSQVQNCVPSATLYSSNS